METFYLIDFENVHNEGIENIDSLTEETHVHIFTTKNALNIRMDIVFSKGIDIHGHIVPARSQSVDMHLVSYLGYLLGCHGNQCSYVIVSKDTDYDNIIKFWQENGYYNICRKQKIHKRQSAKVSHNEILSQDEEVSKDTEIAATQEENSKINLKISQHNFTGEERSELNIFMQHGLVSMEYPVNAANNICKYVIAHCNDKSILTDIHNDLQVEYEDYVKVYKDVKLLLNKFVTLKDNVEKREAQIRSFFGRHFKKKIYVEKKEEIINILLDAQYRQQVNNRLMQLYSDEKDVKIVYDRLQPFLEDLPEK